MKTLNEKQPRYCLSLYGIAKISAREELKLKFEMQLVEFYIALV